MELKDNKLNIELNKNRLFYREMFLKANESFKLQITNLKTNNYCNNRKVCCKIRYTNLPPSEIYEISKKGDKLSSEYTRLFIPYGVDESFDFEKNNHVDLNLNNKLALEVHNSYVNSLLEKLVPPVYFYKCKFLDSGNKCNIDPDAKSILCSSYPNSVATILPLECGFRKWQTDSLDKIKNEITRDIWKKLQDIELFRQRFKCNKTGTCCKLASSEFSYEELKLKAQNGDKFATQFTSVFKPYENVEDARSIFPEYIDLVLSQLDSDEKIYFYHCPYINEQNLCSIYEFRPDICKDFPNNPLSILPPNCSFKEWKDEVSVAAMILHALIEISDFNIQKIEIALE